MKKLTLATLIATAFSLSAFAGNPKATYLDTAHSLTPADSGKIDRTFGALDNDNDGFISQEEADDDEIWEHFSNIDGINAQNADGLVSREEFSTYMSRYTGQVATDDDIIKSAETAKITKLKPITHTFDELDDDDSGFISLEEADGNRVLSHFGYIDNDQDLLVSKREFMRYLADEGTVTQG